MSLQDICLLVAMAAVVALQIAAFVRDVVRARRATIGVKADGTRPIVDKVISFRFACTGQDDVQKAFAQMREDAEALTRALQETQEQTNARREFAQQQSAKKISEDALLSAATIMKSAAEAMAQQNVVTTVKGFEGVTPVSK